MKYESSTVQRGINMRQGHTQGRINVEKPKDRKKTFARLAKYFFGERLEVLLLMVLVFVGVLGSVFAPKYQSSAIDCIVDGKFSEVSYFLAVMLGLYIVNGLSTMLQGYLGAVLSQRMTGRIRDDLFKKIVLLPISYTDTHSHGDLISRITNDADNISNVISQSLSSMFSGVLMLFGTVAMMMWYNVALALLSCSMVILTLFATTLLTKYMRKYYVRRQELLGALNGTINEMIGNTRTVTAYNRQKTAINDFVKTADDLTKAGIIAETISSSMGPVMNCLSNVSFVLVGVFGAWFALRGYITVGVISAFVVYARQFSRPINELAQIYGQIMTALAGAERIFDVLDEQTENFAGVQIEQKTRGVIEFRHVNFSYVPGVQVIKDFSLRIEAGRKIALVGSTGSGKTTIINLLMRFYDIDSGEILLDGQDIRSIALKSLRSKIGIVLQDTVLFTDTVRANLTYSRNDVTDHELQNVASFTGFDKVVKNLQSGYEAVLNSSNVTLSQGQRQLLAIGRAFLSKPEILILDEATSSVDTRLEKHIQDTMTELTRHSTSLIIAHRLSTIQDADEIIVMDHGRIIETGNHRTLLELNGRYRELYETQFSGIST